MTAGLSAFEVVSIRPVEAMQVQRDLNSVAYISTAHRPCSYTEQRVTCQLSLRELVAEAFGCKPYAIAGPEWLKDDLFVLQATMPPGTAKETARRMLQQALIDRFNLKFRFEQRSVEGYAMIQAQGGARLQPADDAQHQKLLTIGERSGAYLTFAPGHFAAVAISLDSLANNIRGLAGLDRPVVNRTGLSGNYKVDLYWRATEEPEDAARGIDPGFLDAVKKQLGLELQKQKIPAQVLVVEHVNRVPSQN